MQQKSWSIDSITNQVVGIDKKVPIINGEEVPYIYLDNAASTPTLKPVLNSLNEFMEWYSNIHRGTGFKSQISTHFFELARDIVAKFFNVNLKDHLVIFGKNGTEAIIGSRYGAWGVFHLAKIFGTRVGYEGPVYWDPDSKRYTSHVENPDDIKAYLTFLRIMTDAGMWDRDFLTMPDSSWDSILRSGRWPFGRTPWDSRLEGYGIGNP